MDPSRLWCRMVFVGPDGRPERTELLQGVGAPDLAAVDVVAHRALAAARAGYRLVLGDLEPALDDLLRLAGLTVQVEGLSVQVEGQAERREQPLRVEEGQEEGHLGDLPA
ncbi:MAG TPA: hypothetical protein VFH58_11955 [Acidimicrobiales bacterium]|nr:hypothetical protein [Acidimicrobiales bacterium]